MSADQSTSQACDAHTINPDGASEVVLVCEHASHHIPAGFAGLGLSQIDRKSHAVWDPGALAVAEALSLHLDAPLVAGQVSRLIYDCNRPPEALDAMPARSELIEVPGNRDLTAAERAARTQTYYHPFHDALSQALAGKTDPVLVTIHSFTPIYHGKPRAVEIGVLHDADTRLADALLACGPAHSAHQIERNMPYGPQNGVTHTLKEHALPQTRPNVMLEIRNDLIATQNAQAKMAKMIAGWLTAALKMNQTQV